MTCVEEEEETIYFLVASSYDGGSSTIPPEEAVVTATPSTVVLGVAVYGGGGIKTIISGVRLGFEPEVDEKVWLDVNPRVRDDEEGDEENPKAGRKSLG